MRNRPYGFEIYLVNVKTLRTIAQIFVAFSEKLNFTNVIWAKSNRNKNYSNCIFWLNSDTNYFGKIKQNIWISRTSYLSILTKNFQFVPSIYTFNSGFYKHCTALQIKYICMCGLNFKKFYSPFWSSRLQPLLLNSLFYSGWTEELQGC